jgi:leucyl aminopeptidase
MKLNSSSTYKNQDAFVLLLSKKAEELPKGLPKYVEEEIKLYIASENKGIEHRTVANKHFFFAKVQKTNEDYRLLGNKVRTLLPKTATSVFISGNKENSFLFAEGLLLSNYQFLKYRKEAEKEQFALEEVDFSANLKDKIIELRATIGAVNWARDMVNEPVSYLTAEQFATEMEMKAKELGIQAKVLQKSQIEALKMGGLLAVNKGSIDPPTFTILEYKPKKPANKKPIVLVGKGVVYDTGGLSLKPTPGSMDSMKCDMAGAAMMAGTIFAAAEMKLDVHLIVLIPATDNRPGLNAYAPGDIITMYDGTTVEVLNTDAEGRMILADALAYSNKLNPELVIDSATLTGAAVRAIGQKASCVMGNADQKILDKLCDSGMQTDERTVLLPFWDDYFEEMKSKIADLNNLGGGMAGMITAGKFLEHFVKAPYVHFDIAGPAYLEKPQNYRGHGGTGYGIRLLIHFLKNWN